MKRLPQRDILENWVKHNPIIREGYVIWVKDLQISLIGNGKATFIELYEIYKTTLRELISDV
jgi:hypothetical protein